LDNIVQPLARSGHGSTPHVGDAGGGLDLRSGAKLNPFAQALQNDPQPDTSVPYSTLIRVRPVILP